MGYLKIIDYELLETEDEKEFYRSANKGYSVHDGLISYNSGGHSFKQAIERESDLYSIYNSGLVCVKCNMELFFNAHLREVAYQLLDKNGAPIMTIGYRDENKFPTCKKWVMKAALE